MSSVLEVRVLSVFTYTVFTADTLNHQLASVVCRFRVSRFAQFAADLSVLVANC